MIYTYLDWNVLNKIEHEKKTKNEGATLLNHFESLTKKKSIIIPYSNAHINDLIRGATKDMSFIEDHLNTIQYYTNNLCIIQFWGHEKVTWGHRNVKEYFHQAFEEVKSLPKTYEGFIDQIGEPIVSNALYNLKKLRADKNVLKFISSNPEMKLIFPRTSTNETIFDFCADIFEFSMRSNADYNLYKTFKKFIQKSLAKLPKNDKSFIQLKQIQTEHASYLDLDPLFQSYAPKSKISDNKEYQKITEVYLNLDLSGLKMDNKFQNLIDDSLHVFYGAHCDFFITMDDNCYQKAKETYRKLNIGTQVVHPTEFIQLIS